MKNYIFFFFFIVYNLILAQENSDPTNTLVSNIEAKMKKENVDDFFIVKHLTYGVSYLFNLNDPDNCNENGYYFQVYLFWKNKNISWVKKYDNCGHFNSIKLDKNNTINYFKKNIKKMHTEEVKRYTMKPDSISEGLKYSFVSSQSHSPLRYFWFYKDSTNFKKHFDKYDLTSKEDLINIYYKSNNNLSLVKLNLMSENIINELEEKKQFKRIL